MKKLLLFLLLFACRQPAFAQKPDAAYALFINQNVYKISLVDRYVTGFKIQGMNGIFTSLHYFLDVPVDSNFRAYQKKIQSIWDVRKRKLIKNDNLKFKISKIDCSRDLVYIEFYDEKYLGKAPGFIYDKFLIDTITPLKQELTYCGFTKSNSKFPDFSPDSYNGMVTISDELGPNGGKMVDFAKLGIPQADRLGILSKGFIQLGYSGGPVLLKNNIIGINCFPLPVDEEDKVFRSFSLVFNPAGLTSYKDLLPGDLQTLENAPQVITDIDFFNQLRKSGEEFKKYEINSDPDYSRVTMGVDKSISFYEKKLFPLQLLKKEMLDSIKSYEKALTVPERVEGLSDAAKEILRGIKRRYYDTLNITQAQIDVLTAKKKVYDDKKTNLIHAEINRLNQNPPYLQTIINALQTNDFGLIRLNAEIPCLHEGSLTDGNKEFIRQSKLYGNYASSLYIKGLDYWYRYFSDQNNRLSSNALDSAIMFVKQLKTKLDTSVFESSLHPEEERVWKKIRKTPFRKDATLLIEEVSKQCDCGNELEKGREYEKNGHMQEALNSYLLCCKNNCTSDAFTLSRKVLAKIDAAYNALINRGDNFSLVYKLDSALVCYQKACITKPLEVYPKKRIQSIKDEQDSTGNHGFADFFNYAVIDRKIQNFNNEIILKQNLVYALPNINFEIKRTGRYRENIQLSFKYGHLDSINKQKLGIKFYTCNYIPGEQTSPEIESALRMINLMIRQNFSEVSDYLISDSTRIDFTGRADAIPFRGALGLKDRQLLKSIDHELVCDKNGSCCPFNELRESRESYLKNKGLAFIRAYLAKRHIGEINSDLVKRENITIHAVPERTREGGEYRGVEIQVYIKLNVNMFSASDLERIQKL